LERFEPAGLVIEVSEIVTHEADEPDSVVGLLDADILAGEDGHVAFFSSAVTLRTPA
jgi:hypothetical protein